MNLNQFRVTKDTPYKERSVLLGSEYTAIGRIVADIQEGYYQLPSHCGWQEKYRIVHKHGSIAIVKGRETKASWRAAENIGHQSITRLWAVVNTTTHEVLSYYAILMDGTYDGKGNKSRVITDTRKGGM